MFKNAGLTSREDAKTALDAGTRFWVKRFSGRSDRQEIKRDDSMMLNGQSPYRIGNDALDAAWDHYADWEVQCEWFASIPERGIMCWVRDRPMQKPLLGVVVRHHSFRVLPFQTATGTFWKYAIPATKRETENLYAV